MEAPMSLRQTDPFRQARVCDCGGHGFVGLTRGLVALCDAGDVPLIAGTSWRHLHTRGGAYAISQTSKESEGGARTIYMHRLFVAEPGKLTDHRSRDRLDNRRDNLRPCTPAQNSANAHRASTRPYKGVEERNGHFRACLEVGGKPITLCGFSSAEEAARAYDAAALRHFGEFALTNAMLGLLPQGSSDAR
jgi:hypothetical protein